MVHIHHKVYIVHKQAYSMMKEDVRFVIERGRIIEVKVGDYKFQVKETPASNMDIIESLFKQLIERGVLFTKEEEKKIEEKYLEFTRSLTNKQRNVLVLFKDKEEVHYKEIYSLGPDYEGQKFAGISSGLTRKAQRLGIIGDKESALIWNSVNETYRLNPKLKPVLKLLEK